jgi:hypothetical protein
VFVNCAGLDLEYCNSIRLRLKVEHCCRHRMRPTQTAATPDDALDRGLWWWEPRLAQLHDGAPSMNTTTTEITAKAGNAPATSPKATPSKRRMAREPGHTGTTGATIASDSPQAAATPAPTSKIGAVLGLLDREQGASLADMVAATGWLPHTTRAALTGLKKKGHIVTSTKADGVRTYQRVPAGTGEGASPAETDAKVEA